MAFDAREFSLSTADSMELADTIFLSSIDLFTKIGYFIDSLVISKFLTRREMCFNGNYLYGGLVLKLNSRHTRKKAGKRPYYLVCHPK